MSVVATQRKSDIETSGVASNSPVIKDQIQETLNEIKATHKQNIERDQDLNSLIEAWNERLKLVARKIQEAKKSTPDAVHSLEVMQDQAQRYVLSYKDTLKQEKEYAQKVSESIPQLTVVLRQLEAIDKVSLLDAKLQKITEGTNIAEGRLAVTNTRDLQILLHTAQALVELKKGK
jgi:ABC-type transporter Mla subunit MlaD